jgi:tripartite-type tricarboxylate transporter receptor subunit TctC
MNRSLFSRARAVALAGAMLTALAPAFAWEPSKTVEFIVPAGTGGGADQMARLIQSIIAKHNHEAADGRRQQGRRRRAEASST